MKTTRVTVIPALLLVLATAPSLVAGQGPDERIRDALDHASEAGIPTSLLESKVQEGRAKGLPLDRIADAVQHRLDGLASARQALADVPDAGADDLSVAADALESGVSEAVLVELAETAPRERRAAAIAALGYLVGADVAPQEALDRVEDALTRDPAALQSLPARAPGAASPGAPAGLPVPAGVDRDGPARDAGAPSDVPGGPPGE